MLLYQLIAGDFRKPIAAGWEADIADPVLRQDVADAACGDPARRLKTVAALVDRIENLGARRAEQRELERSRLIGTRRMQGGTARRWLTAGAVALAVAGT